jgi:RNA polymerase-interacting CarD/CdnL/TRCF family regulator
MLTLIGDIDEEQLVEEAKKYLPLYGKEEKEECRVPFKDANQRKVRFVIFLWLAKQWVFTEII